MKTRMVVAFVVAAALLSIPTVSPPAHAVVTMTSSSDTFFGPGFVRVLITDTALDQAGDTIVPTIEARDGSTVLGSINPTIEAIGTSGQFELFITTSDAPLIPANPTKTAANGGLAGAVDGPYVIRIFDGATAGLSTVAPGAGQDVNGGTPAHGSNDYGMDFNDFLDAGDNVRILYGGQTLVVNFDGQTASLAADRLTAGQLNEIVLALTDGDPNLDPTTPDSFILEVNGTDPSSTYLWTETGQNTGVFELTVVVNDPTADNFVDVTSLPTSITFTAQDHGVYTANVPGATAPYDALIDTTNETSASVNIQNSDGLVSLVSPPTLTNGLIVEIFDADRNISTTTEDTIPGSDIELEVEGIGIATLTIDFEETDDNTGVFRADVIGEGIPILVGTTDAVTGNSITLTAATIASDSDIIFTYTDPFTAGVDNEFFIITNLLHTPGVLEASATDVSVNSDFSLQLSDPDLDTNPDTIEAYVVTSGAFEINGETVAELPLTAEGNPVLLPVTDLDIIFIETAPNTGVFVAQDLSLPAISAAGPGELSDGDEVAFTYTDLMEDQLGTVESSATITVSVIELELSLDRTTAGPASTVFLTLAYPDLNKDGAVIEIYVFTYEAGSQTDAASGTVTAPDDSPLASLSMEIAGTPRTVGPAPFSVTFIETAPNTGVFSADVGLGELATAVGYSYSNGDTVLFEVTDEQDPEAEIKPSAFATVTLDLGAPIITLDKTTYGIGDTVFITVDHVASNISGDTVDQIDVHISSDTDPLGFDLTLFETAPNTSIFAGSFVIANIEPGAPSWSIGDTIYVEYLGEVTTALIGASIEITSISCVNDVIPGPCASFPPSLNWTEESIELVEMDAVVVEAGEYSVVLENRNPDGITTFLAWLTFNAAAGSSTSVGLGPIGYTADDVGVNTLRAFLLMGDVGDPGSGVTAVAPIDTATVVVVGGLTPTILSLDEISNVVGGTKFTVTGSLSLDGGEGLSGQTIALGSSGGVTSLPASVTTGGVVFSSPHEDGLEIQSCPTAAPSECLPDFETLVDADGVNKVLHIKEGAMMSFPAGTKGVILYLQDMGTTPFTYQVAQSDSLTFVASSHGAAPNVQSSAFIGAAGADVSEITILDVGTNPDSTVGLAAIRLIDPLSQPSTLLELDFEDLADGVASSPLEIAAGFFVATALAPDSGASSVSFSVTASIDGDGISLGDSSDTKTAMTIPDTLLGEGDETAVYPLEASKYNVETICASDNDRDAICDEWETNGIPYVQNGVTKYYNLCYTSPFTGLWTCPSPNQKDLFVEIDYMAEHKIELDAILDVRRAFDDMGIKLHIFQDAMINERDYTYVWIDPGGESNGIYDDFKSIKDLHFGFKTNFGNPAEVYPIPFPLKEAKAKVYHYGLSVHSIGGCPSPTGLAEVKGNDFVIALGCPGLGDSDGDGHVNGTVAEQAGTLFHELGHNLNLDHGGPREIFNSATGRWTSVDSSVYSQNCKPNYLSGMSYSRQIPGFIPIGYWSPRYSDQAMPYLAQTLSEGSLNEREGVVTDPTIGDTYYRIVYGTPEVGGYATGYTYKQGKSVLAINWDGARGYRTSTTADISNFGIIGCGHSPSQNLMGMDDVNNLNFDFRNGNTYIDGIYSPSPPELTSEIAAEIKEVGGPQYSDLLPPLSVDDRKTFNLRSTIPVKFELWDFDGNPIPDATASIEIVEIVINPDGSIDELPPPIDLDDTLFRYDETQQQFVFNWNLNDIKGGTYGIKVLVQYAGADESFLLDSDQDGYSAIVTIVKGGKK